jgi:hypothetical protein
MKIFKLTGKESVMSLHLEHPIHLDGEYKLALTGFYSDNNIANLKQEAKIYFHYPQVNGKVTTIIVHALTLEKKFWTLETLTNKCRNFLQGLLDTQAVTNIDPNNFSMIKSGDRVAINSPLGFYLDSSVCKLLGFELSIKPSSEVSSYYTANINHTGTKLPNLRAVDVIEIHCNLVEHSFVNHDTHWHKHDETEILYHFFPNVPHGYKISEMPNEFHYIPLRNITAIREIKIMIKDQDNQLLVNEGVNNIVYLNLVKV